MRIIFSSQRIWPKLKGAENRELGANQASATVTVIICHPIHIRPSREVYERRMWVIRWRVARLQCQYPRNDVYPSFYYYDKRSGESLEVSSCLSKLVSAKAQITKAERRMNEYIEHNRQNNMFFDENTDEELVKFREKLERKKLECAECEKRLEQLVEKGEIINENEIVLPISGRSMWWLLG